jgi:hypothetical protein
VSCLYRYVCLRIVLGDLSNFEAGKVGTVLVNLNDKWGNSLTVGGASIELALIGVAGYRIVLLSSCSSINSFIFSIFLNTAIA